MVRWDPPPPVQGIYWVRQREGAHLGVGRLGQPDLVPRLVQAITLGTTFLIENMGERIDPVLWPIICQATIKRGTRRLLRCVFGAACVCAARGGAGVGVMPPPPAHPS